MRPASRRLAGLAAIWVLLASPVADGVMVSVADAAETTPTFYSLNGGSTPAAYPKFSAGLRRWRHRPPPDSVDRLEPEAATYVGRGAALLLPPQDQASSFAILSSDPSFPETEFALALKALDPVTLPDDVAEQLRPKANMNPSFSGIVDSPPGPSSELYVAPDQGGGSPGDSNLRLPVTPVPEPESWAMLLAGLGVTTVIARRRKTRS